jgi:hypothetical protein
MALILCSLLSCGNEKNEPRFICLSKAKASLRFKTWIASGLKKILRYTIYFPQNPRQSYPLWVSQKGPYIEEGLPAGHFLYPSKTSSFRFPNKGDLPEAPSMEPLKEGNKSPFIQPSKSPVKKPFSRFRKRSLYKNRCPSLESFLLSKSPLDEPSPRFPKSGAPL